ncbi:CHASE2 domain-containing protein [Nostoc sp. 'Peltigera membranacea cyanobiont' 232]|uniref:CHASE2 domain-containing protein n=1 Tax=Nostoc sp. 'Peltigera membranacea cyanobiont' 232 TaxID=2014531 RepID=UPI000B95BF90|nr:CHASE2 domain-containing protein [Nostoc sp. 'Peltigera membranacea cyanobiont' 232]OYE00543.1 Chase2 sensor protein [Nostoc sp. 'Peltigera membranacea cyanobiont' 232]
MSKLVVFSFLGGDLNQGFPVVTAQLWCHNQFVPVKLIGSLPPAPELSELYRRWQLLYAAVHQRLGSNQRIKVHSQDITNISVNDFDEVCQQLQANINVWLKFESFQNIDRQLRTLLSHHDEIRVIIETNIVLMHRLPWHLWHFSEDYPKAELALSNHEYESPQLLQKSPTGKVKILAILGNRVGIDIDKDASFLQGLTDAKTTFLIEPTRQRLDEYLWNHDWDILFFAGHSNSLADGDTGEICINQTETLAISQLKNALKAAIRRGLKLAILNSCDGIGLGRNLADLNIPQMIVMREGVPDLIAQEFLKNFLTAFGDSKPFYLAVREARERLQGLENKFPCASWLPVICQNPTTVPTTWQELRGNFGDIKFVGEVSTKDKFATPKLKFWNILLSTLIVAVSTLGLRYLGVFEKIELQTFDQMLRLRPKEDPDPRLIIVEITEKDIQSRQETTKGLKSISDSTLAKLLNKLQKYQARVIGLDIYRDFADPPNRSNLIQLSTEFSKDNVVVVCKSRDSKYDPQGVKPPKDVPVERQGFTDAIQDPDGIVRRQILMMAQEPSSTCTTPYSLSLQLAIRYLSYENIKPKFNEDYVQFGSKVFKRLKPSRSGAYQQGVDLGGNQILVNYRNTDYQRVSLDDVLSDEFDHKSLKDKVVIIGVTANTVNDTWSTLYSTAQQDYQEIPGIFIQAQMVSQVLSAVLDQRPILWVLPYWGDILWICSWSVVGSLIIWRVRSLSDKGCAIFVIVVILYGVCAIALLKQGLWLPFIPSAFAVVGSGVVVVLIQRHQEFFTIPQPLVK